MSPVEWYYARDKVQMGPVSSVELKRLATAGELEPEHLVWREGMTEWSLARNVRGLFEEEEKPAVVAPPQVAASEPARTPEIVAGPAIATGTTKATSEDALRHPLEIGLDRVRQILDARRLDGMARGCQLLGASLLLVAMALVLTLAILAATKASPVSNVLHGLAMILVLASVHYAASKLCRALPQRSQTLSGRLSSRVFPNCLAVLSALGSAAVVLGGVAVVVQSGDYFGLALGLAGFVALAYAALVALDHDALNLTVNEDISLAEECLGWLTCLVKLLVRLAPVMFGVGTVLGTAVLGIACYLAIRGADPLGTGMLSAMGLVACIYAGLLPLAIYLVLLLFSLLAAICRGLLCLPAIGNGAAASKEESPAAEPLSRAS